jgi:hypothetical protein
MSRWALVLGTCEALASAGSAVAAPSSPIVTARDTHSDAAVRDATAAVMTRELRARLAETTCEGCHVDASVTRLDVVTTETGVAVTAEVHVAISDARGTMIAVLAGGARGELARSTVLASRLATLRNDALTAAVDGAMAKVAGVLPATRHFDAYLTTLLRWFGVGASRELPLS